LWIILTENKLLTGYFNLFESHLLDEWRNKCKKAHQSSRNFTLTIREENLIAILIRKENKGIIIYLPQPLLRKHNLLD